MRPLLLISKSLWWSNHYLTSWLRAVSYRLLLGSYFGHIGWGSRFGRNIRFGSPNANIFLCKNCSIGDNVFLCTENKSYIKMAEGASISFGCVLISMHGIRIGKNSALGELTSVRDHNHEFKDANTPFRIQGYRGAAIDIGDDVWIGRGAFIGPGVHIGNGAVVGANSVVVRDVDPYTVVAGCPARFIKRRGL